VFGGFLVVVAPGGLGDVLVRYQCGISGVDRSQLWTHTAVVVIGVLGPLRVGGDASALGPRDRVVLAVLALRRGGVVGPDELADALWGDEPPASWTKGVQGCVMRLRKLLGSGAIETLPHGYRLTVPADRVDARRFEQLVVRGRELMTLGEPERASYVIGEALALWHGRALIDLEGWEPGRTEAGRLEELRLEAEEARLDAALRAARHREVLGEAQRLVAEAPLREDRWALLALAEYRSGRQGDALRTLHRARSVLAGELGVDPGPDLVALEQAILRQDPSLAPATEPPEPSATCPYLGLVPYDLRDADVFFGRDAEVAACLERLAATGVVVVVGPSGSGKSSLVRAGVGAALRREGRPVTVVTPGARPTQALTAARDAEARPVLVVDQCEEAVTLCDDALEQESFFAALAGRAEQAPLVVALRADRLADVSRHAPFARLVERGLHLLRAMDGPELRAAIEGPAHQAGLLLEPGLVDLLVRDVEGEPGALPMLSHALRKTWEGREGRTLTVGGYRHTGGIRGAVARSAEDVYDQATPAQRAILRDLLLRLVTTGPTGEPTRLRVPRRQVATDPEHEKLIEVLVAARLVTSDDGVVELAHEALARAWPRLRGWLDDDIEGQRTLRHLTVAADTWEAMSRPDSELYRGVRLTSALDWRDRAHPRLSSTERAFLDASLELADRARADQAHQLKTQARTNRRLRRLLAGVALALVIALVAATFALVQRNRADDATQRATVGRLVAESGALRDRDRSLSALLAVTANRLDDNAATRGALQKELMAEPRLRATLTGSALPKLVAYTPDGTELVVRAPSAVDVFDTRRGRLSGRVSPVPGAARGWGLAISPDGKLFATGGGDHRAHVFDLQSRREVGAPIRAGAPVEGVAFSPDSSMLATGAATFGDTTPVPTDKTVQLWDVATSRQLPVSFSGHTGSVNAVAFSPDGQLLATGGNDHLVVVHDPRTGATVGPPMRVGGEVYSLAFSPDTSRLAVGTMAPDAVVFDVRTGLQVGSTVGAGPVDAVAFSSDGARLVTSSAAANTTIAWDAATFNAVGTPMAAGGYGVAFRPGGHEFAITGASPSTVTLWDPEGDPLITHRIPGTSPYGGRYSPDGTVLAVPDTNAVTLYDARTLQPLGPPLPAPGRTPLTSGPTPTAIAFSPDSTQLAVAGATVEFFDVATLHPVGPSVPLETLSLSLTFSPDGKTLAVGGTQGDLYLVDLPSGRPRGPLSGLSYFVFNEVFSPDGRRLVATSSSGRAMVYNHLRRAQPPATPLPDHPKNVSAARFSPDGSLLATGGGDGTLQLRDGHTLRPLGPPIPTNQPEIIGIGFTRDSRLLAIADLHSTVKLVDVATRQPIGDPFVGAGVSPPAQPFRPDGRVLALSGPGGASLVTLDVAEWRADACRLVGRNLTPAESREYLGTDGPRVNACPGYPHPH
jgi:WD40 repeat protein/DNA-binding SARP family transcriptional activator/energy-coupling factor transporter ATP-binding protein EcfA2